MAWNKPSLGVQLNTGSRLADGLVGCWLMNEGCGSRFYNIKNLSIGLGTLGTDTTWRPGENGHCLDFIATASPTEIEHGSTLNFDGYTDSYTFVISVKGGSQPSGYRIIEKRVGSLGPYPITIQGNAGTQPVAQIYDGANAPNVSLGTVFDNSWHVVAFVVNYAADYLYGYNNGVLIDSAQNTVTATTANGLAYRVGNRYDMARDLVGQIGYIVAYSRALSPEEVLNLYISPFAMFEHRRIWAFSPGPTISIFDRYYKNRRIA